VVYTLMEDMVATVVDGHDGRRGCDGEAVYVIVRAAWRRRLLPVAALTSLHMLGTLHRPLACFMFSYITIEQDVSLESFSEPARV
jgi:hypothetical protein